MGRVSELSANVNQKWQIAQINWPIVRKFSAAGEQPTFAIIEAFTNVVNTRGLGYKHICPSLCYHVCHNTDYCVAWHFLQPTSRAGTADRKAMLAACAFKFCGFILFVYLCQPTHSTCSRLLSNAHFMASLYQLIRAHKKIARLNSCGNFFPLMLRWNFCTSRIINLLVCFVSK